MTIHVKSLTPKRAASIIAMYECWQANSFKCSNVARLLHYSRAYVQQELSTGNRFGLFVYPRPLPTCEEIVLAIGKHGSMFTASRKLGVSNPVLARILKQHGVTAQKVTNAVRRDAGRESAINDYIAVAWTMGCAPNDTDLQHEHRAISGRITHYWGSSAAFRAEFGITHLHRRPQGGASHRRFIEKSNAA